ncbi:MAG TPA: XdhC/CoxI family protein [Gemmatimonadaceae bacterium]|nr:XdhC/CoxI family protein [Gemmatimonadaceae bacterium]
MNLPKGRAAMATLVATEGSSPRSTGSRMWVDEAGRIVGSVTIGGCVDARVIEASTRALENGEPALLTMALGDEDAWAIGMTCAGTIEVLVEPVDPADPVALALGVASDEVQAGRTVVIVATLSGAPRRLVVKEGGGTVGTLGDASLDDAAMREAAGLLEEGTSGVRSVGGQRLYFERHAPPLTLVVFGATHVAMPLVSLGGVMGLRTVVVDGRDVFATRDRFPGADELIVGMPSELAERMPLGRQSLVVLLSHDYKYDLPVLRAVLASDAAYVGVLGSRRRGKALLEFLSEEGVPADQLARVRIPVGLDLGGSSPEEIALSVLAEAIAVHHGRSGGPMRDRPASR